MTTKPQACKSPQDSCNELLHTLRESNLHFIVSETPYSVQICIRKKFINNPSKVKNSVPSSASLSVIKGFEKRIEDLKNEKASLSDALKKSNENITNLEIAQEMLQNKIETAEKKIFEVYKEKKEDIKKFENESAIYRTKAKSLEKSIIGKDKKIENIKNSLETARDTIEELKSELSRHTTSEIKLEAVQKNLVVGEYTVGQVTEMDHVRDVNENLFEPPSKEPESWGMQVKNTTSLVTSTVRKVSPTRSPPGTPPSPHTPPWLPPSSSSSELSVFPSGTSISCYFGNPVPDLERKPVTEEYIRNLSKLNLAPRVRKQEDT